jgi:hypothetical protein
MFKHDNKGLQQSAVRVSKDDMIQFEGVNNWIDITTVDTVTSQIGETYIDKNGVKIDVETFIDHMILTKPQYDNLRSAYSYQHEKSERVYDSRVQTFLHILQTQLKGVVDFTRR